MVSLCFQLATHVTYIVCRYSGADPEFRKGGFNLVPNSDTGGATNNYF